MATAENLSAAMIEGTLNNFDVAPEAMMEPPAPGAVVDTLQHMPGFITGAGVTAVRGSNTILRGGWAANAGPNQFIRGTLRNNNPFNPRSWSRYSSQEIFQPGRAHYTPFQTISGTGNWLQRRGMLGGALRNAGEDAFGRGTLSRITAASRVARMSESQLAGASGLKNFLGPSASAGRLSGSSAAATILGQTQGAITGRAAGFLSGARYGAFAADVGATRAARVGNVVARRMAREVGMDVTKRYGLRGGAQLIGRQFARQGGARLAGKAAMLMGARAGLALSGVGAPILAAWAAYDLAKMGVTAVGHLAKGAIRTGLDAYQSYRGNMGTGIMETGFKDNSATMTSRSRGVAAIQNSRLNARSILGTEAGAMHAHFG